MTVAHRAAPGSVHHRIAPDRLYWAELDTAALRAAGAVAVARPGARRLGYLFETQLPVAIETVHAIYTPIPGRAGRVLACAIDAALLREIASATPGLLTLTPESLPPFIDVPIDPGGLNLLVGVFEPAPVKRARRAVVRNALAAAVLVLGAVVLGLERRTAWARSEERALRAAADAVYGRILGPATAGVEHPQPPSVRLESQLRLLRRTRGEGAARVRDGVLTKDAAEVMGDLLGAWPRPTKERPLYVETESISVAAGIGEATGNSITLTTLLPDHDTAEAFQAGLGTPAGYVKQQPQITSQAPSGVRVTMRYTPAASAGGERREGVGR